jgi:AraC family transcriptional regulator
MSAILDEKPLVLDFGQESISSEILPRSPLLSSHRLEWKGVRVEYHHQPPHQIPEFCPTQHLVVIHTEMPSSIHSEQTLDGRFSDQPAKSGDVFIVPANVFYQAQWNSKGSFILISLEPTTFIRTIYESIDPDRVELLPHLQTPDPEEKPGQSWSAFAERPYPICSFDELTLKIGALGGR